MSPSLNSTLVTKPPTRGRTCTSSPASNRPVNSSQSVTVRLTGCATVTGGAAAAAGGGELWPQPDSEAASTIANGPAAQRARKLLPIRPASLVDCSAAPTCITPHILAAADRGGPQ